MLYYENSASGYVEVSENDNVEIVAVRQVCATEVVSVVARVIDSFAVCSEYLHLCLDILLQVGYDPAVVVSVAVGRQYVGYRDIDLFLLFL